MRKLLFLLPLCFAMLFIQAQNFEPGYVVKKSGDTARGYIESMPIYQLVQNIHYKNNLSEEGFTTYTIKDISAFGLDAGRFFRALEYKDDLHDYESKTEFAKVAVLGHYNLYSIPRETQDYFYIKSEQDTGYLLYPDRIYDQSYFPGNYRNILIFLSRDCSNEVGNIESLFYSEKDIAKVVTKLNRCISPGTVSKVSVQRAKIKIQGTASVNGMYLGYENHQYNFNGAVRVMFPELNKKFSLNLGYTYYAQNRLVKTDMLASHKTELVETTTQSSIPFYVNYYFLEGRVRPYLHMGVSYTFWESERTLRIYNSAYNNGGIQENQMDHLWVDRAVFLGAAGVEVFLYKGLGFKTEIKFETDLQWATVGIFYLFNK